jgi:TorA maturation chaperone TorD
VKSGDLQSVLKKRFIIYTFLKRIYERELPQEFIAEIPQKMKPLLAVSENISKSESKRAIKELIQFTDTLPSQDLKAIETKLAADYARLFLSINKVPPHPSESTYREGTPMQYYRDEVLRTYWSHGVDKTKEFTEPEDHIAVELSFLTYLCQKAIDAMSGENIQEAAQYIREQKNFIEMHLMKWVPKLVKDILNTAQTPFYKAIAVITEEYIEADFHATEDMLKQLSV